MFEVFTITLTNFLAKIIYSRGYRGCKKMEEIPEGWGRGGGGGVILAIKIWKFPGVRGAYVKFPPWWGAHIFWKAHILDTMRNKDHLSEATVSQKIEKTKRNKLYYNSRSTWVNTLISLL